MKNKEYDHLFKFVMVGQSAVGKSSLLLRFADDQFNQNYMITIGVDFRFKSFTVNSKIVKLQIWDTAGQQRFRTIVNTYYKSSQAVFMVFDLSNQDSFNHIKSYWINQVESFTDSDVNLILIGNKSDGSHKVSKDEINKFIAEKNIKYYETSAKNGQNVKLMFEQVAKDIINKGTLIGNNSQNTGKKLQNYIPQNKRWNNYCEC